MQGREINLLSVDELVVCDCAHIFNVVDQKGVGGGMMGQENDLCSSGSKGRTITPRPVAPSRIRKTTEADSSSVMAGPGSSTVHALSGEAARSFNSVCYTLPSPVSPGMSRPERQAAASLRMRREAVNVRGMRGSPFRVPRGVQVPQKGPSPRSSMDRTSAS